jgi:hypothetical protein
MVEDIVERPPRRKRRRASPDFRNSITILGSLWAALLLVLLILKAATH